MEIIPLFTLPQAILGVYDFFSTKHDSEANQSNAFFVFFL